MAQNGMRFVRGYSGPVCAPSRCTLMTGLHLGHCTVRGNDGSYSPMLKTDVTVARVLQKAGYLTFLSGKWGEGNFNTTGYPTAQGFDFFLGQDSQVACHNWYPYLIQNNSNDSYALSRNEHASEATCGANRESCDWSNNVFAQRALGFIRYATQQAKPFFLYFATTTPHVGDLSGANTGYPVPAPYNTQFTQYTETLNLFAGAVAAQDAYVGQIMQQLKDSGVYDNTLVIFSGDNGPDSHDFTTFDDPGVFRGKKRSLHEGGVRQTILAQWPARVKAGTTNQHIFAFWDLLPTAADAAGIPRDSWPPTDGISALGALLVDGPQQQQQRQQQQAEVHDARAPLYWEFCMESAINGLLPQLYKPGWIQAMRWDDGPTEWKAIRSNRGPMLLFNLTADPSEYQNLTAHFPAVVNYAAKTMETERTDNLWWPAAGPGPGEKCCNSCFKAEGCAAPCWHAAPGPTPPTPSPPPHPVPLRELNGEWTQGDNITYTVGVDVAARTILLRTIHCPDCKWNSAEGTVSANGEAIKVTATGPDGFEIKEKGQVFLTGSEIHIQWSQRWADWQRKGLFDYD